MKGDLKSYWLRQKFLQFYNFNGISIKTYLMNNENNLM